MSEQEISQTSLDALRDFIAQIPAVQFVSGKITSGGHWWLKLGIDIEHRLAWNVVQELGFILNYISLNDKLPTIFMPVSPPPYLNGGPREFLSWVIETREPIDPAFVKVTLEGRMPRPVNDEAAWSEESSAEK